MSACEVGGCDAGSPRERWLRGDLDGHPTRCTVAYWHHPLFSSGEHGSDPMIRDIWEVLYRRGVDVVLNGHDHDYERFAPQDPFGRPRTNGVRQFVVGTGGRSLYSFPSAPAANSEKRIGATLGVLALTLHAASYDWQFLTASGARADAGTAACH